MTSGVQQTTGFFLPHSSRFKFLQGDGMGSDQSSQVRTHDVSWRHCILGFWRRQTRHHSLQKDGNFLVLATFYR